MGGYKFIISGGGTGGHIFPALSIADGLKKQFPESDILFVGAEGKMEMEKSSGCGISYHRFAGGGFSQGRNTPQSFFFSKTDKVFIKGKENSQSIQAGCRYRCRGLCQRAILRQANNLGIPTVLQEQNSYAGVTNKILGKKASKICVAYDKMDRFFPSEKIVYTGNPVRSGLLVNSDKREEAVKYFGTDPGKPVILVLGGSLGARTINQSIRSGLDKIKNSEVQMIWQTGKIYYQEIKSMMDRNPVANVSVHEFISRMDFAFSLADIVITRAGAGTISELCIVGKPSILVPSPNVAEDHQTHNAMSLVEKDAAILVKDTDSVKILVDTALDLVGDRQRCGILARNIRELGTPDSTKDIVEVISGLLKKKMIKTDTIQKVYLPGIGGIGMSALARYFHFLGKKVGGYDKTPSALTKELEAEGIPVHYEADLNKLPLLAEKDTTLVIYTPAVPESFPEMQYFRKNGFHLYKRSKVLGLLTSGKRCIAIAGTHGKTSVTTMTAHLFRNSTLDCSAFMGGISKNYGTNLLLPNKDTDIIVVEADEFDRSFLQLHPQTAVVTYMDADHLDIYGNHEEMIHSFHDFIGQIKEEGILIYRSGLGMGQTRSKGIRYYSYTIIGDADFAARNISVKEGSYHFDLKTPFGEIKDLRLCYPGLLNVENAVAACAAALLNGVKEEEIIKALPEFKGVVRRFDIRYSGKKTIYIDDYAHHPRELEATIRSVRDFYPGKKITGIFQPHLFTRTRDFAEGFAKSLDLLDEALLMEIYPAREEPIEGVDAGLILKYMKLENKVRCNRDDFPSILENYDPEILITLGAGDIDRLAEPIVEYLKGKENV